jgi:hypothetical protein
MTRIKASKVFINKRNGQASATIPKKLISKSNLKYDEELFVEIKLIKRRKK